MPQINHILTQSFGFNKSHRHRHIYIGATLYLAGFLGETALKPAEQNGQVLFIFGERQVQPSVVTVFTFMCGFSFLSFFLPVMQRTENLNVNRKKYVGEVSISR